MGCRKLIMQECAQRQRIVPVSYTIYDLRGPISGKIAWILMADTRVVTTTTEITSGGRRELRNPRQCQHLSQRQLQRQIIEGEGRQRQSQLLQRLRAHDPQTPTWLVSWTRTTSIVACMVCRCSSGTQLLLRMRKNGHSKPVAQ